MIFTKQNISKAIEQLNFWFDKDLKVKIEAVRPIRSLPQNRYLHGVVFSVLAIELGLTIDEVPEMYKKKVQCSIKDTTILEWLDVNSINDPVKIKFVEFKPSVSSKELMDRGITGRELGLEIKRLEIENFKKIL